MKLYDFNYIRFTDYIYEILNLKIKNKQKIIEVGYVYYGDGTIPFFI